MSKITLMILFLTYLILVLQTNFILSSETDSCKSDTQCGNGVCINASCVCNDGWKGSDCQFCDGRFRLTAPEGQIHDGAGDYATTTKCSWLIDTDSTKPIKLTFHTFSTECGWDHLHVFDGSSIYSPLVGSYSGISEPIQDVVLESGSGFLYFFSDVAYSMGGFNITYRLISCPLDCSSHGVCDTNSDTCLCEDGWSGMACEIRSNCPSNCSADGNCVNGACVCHPNHAGDDCSIDTRNASWVTVRTNSAPLGRASLGADKLGDYLYVYGGERLHNRYLVHHNDTVDFYRYNILSKTWFPINSTWSTADRFGHTLSADHHNLQMYLYGGTVNGLPQDHLASYDVITGLWTSLPPGQIAVTGHTAHVIGDKLYVFFGQSAVYGFPHLIQVYDIIKSQWTLEPTLGVIVRGRYGHSSVYDVDSNSVFVFGGYHDNSKPGSYLLTKSLFKFLVDSFTWVGLTPAHRPSYLHSAALLTEGYMIVTGGNSHNDTIGSTGTECYSSNLLAYDMCCDTWIDVDVADTTVTKINRFGHTMFIHNTTAYVYGGFNGVMLDDLVSLRTPICSLFTDEDDCETGGALQNNNTHGYGVCRWDSGLGCVRTSRLDACGVTSCSRPTGTETLKCAQFLDCTSCLLTEGCYYRPDQRGNPCSNVPPPSTSNPALQDVTSCVNMTCSVHQSCEMCNLAEHCLWSVLSKRCHTASKYVLAKEDKICEASCHTHNSCSNCTGSKCLWCESQSQCIDSNSYLTYYIYGQCLEWTTSLSKCSEVACSEINSCEDCQKNAMCGWCDHASKTGKGSCMRGGLMADLNSACASDLWHFTTCPGCQCNGHSTCDSTDRCLNCTGNTAGKNCEICAPGYYGDAINDGVCQRCDCSGVGETCDDKTGACLCMVQGAQGDRCERCDALRQYKTDTINNHQCYYELGVDYRYTFNFSKPEEKHISVVNMQCSPKYDDRDMELTVSCRSQALINLTLYSLAFPGRYMTIPHPKYCYNGTSPITISHDDFPLDARGDNSTLLLTLYNFTSPFVFQVSFSQYSRINLFNFFLIFFGCFLALLIIAGLVWKMRARYAIMQRRSMEREERRNMASRPFASLLLSVDDLKNHSNLERTLAAKPVSSSRECAGGAEPPVSAFQRTFSKRSKNKQSLSARNSATVVGLEPLGSQRSVAVASVLVKLPTGGQEVPGYDCSGLAFGTALISINPNSTTNYAISKVSYKHGKVVFKSPASLFHPA